MESSAKGLKLKASRSKDVKVVTKNVPKLSKVNNMLFFRKKNITMQLYWISKTKE